MQERRSQIDSGSAGHVSFIEAVKEQAQHITSEALGLLFPLRCAGCRRVDELLCSECRADFVAVTAPFCPCCGEPDVEQIDTCPRCTLYQSALSAGRSVFRFEGKLRQTVHVLKFERRPEVAAMLVAEMLEALRHESPESLSWRLDVIMPVPLHPQRQRERGYNQSRLLAEPLAAAWEIQFADDWLARVRDTRPQVGLDATQRRENTHAAFEASDTVVGLDVLLVDDVRTTGATLESCAVALRNAGAKSVYAVTLAQAV